MSKKTLTVELPETLYHKLIEVVTTKGGLWRSWRKKATATDAIESAVAAALMLFLKGLTGDSELPEFREYAREKYPQLDEDIIIMMADLIETEIGKK